MKKCCECEKIKSTSDFYSHGSYRDGLRYECKECTKGRTKSSYNPDKAKAYAKEYNKAHKEQRAKDRQANLAQFLLNACEVRAKKKGLDFNITIEDIVIPAICPRLKIPLFSRSGKSGGGPNSPSVDRVDPSKGYIKGNVQVISWRANELKSNATVEEILLLAESFKKERI